MGVRQKVLQMIGRVNVLVVCLCMGLAACGRPQPIHVILAADGQRRLLTVPGSGLTVRDLVEALDISIGPMDRVEPDLYALLSDDVTVTVTRVNATFETERLIIPFQRKTVRSEGVGVGERRLLQVGINGEVEITYQVTLEDGEPVSREEVSREVLVEPEDEVVLVGVLGELDSVAIPGTIAYISGGNAWIVRDETGLRRNLTGSSDLDGRVFDLSADGIRLLFTRGSAEGVPGPLNSLWMARTSLIGEAPEDLGIEGIIWAQWSPDGARIAYSTGERAGGSPGWKAANDLWLVSITDEGADADRSRTNVLPTTADVPYAWWGRSFEWGPSGEVLAYAQADEVGVVRIPDGSTVPIASFSEYRTRSSWAWVPAITWAADGSLLAYVAHENDEEGQSPVDSPLFGLWAASPDGELRVKLLEEVGMWSSPRWAPVVDGPIAFGQAQSPRYSQDSRYDIVLVDRDGSNRRHLYPEEGQLGLIAPDLAWSPDGAFLLLADQGNLHMVDAQTGALTQLTSDGQGSHPRWAK